MTTFVPQWQDEIDQLRQYLHQHPEPSGEEHNTAAFVCKTLQKLAPSQLIAGIGGTGVIAIFDSGQAGASVLFRTELDALPIQEVNTFAHKSVNEGVSHKCGHDGHMAVMLGFAKTIAENPLEKGRAILLFQPAEETGAGAELMLRDPKFQRILPVDYAVSFHNLPGFPKGAIVCKKGPFSASVKSLILNLEGKTAHAAEPENGINPAMAMAEILQLVNSVNQPEIERNDFAIITPVHLQMGEVAYGVSAGQGSVHFTLRTWTEAEMAILSKRLLKMAHQIAKKHHLRLTTKWAEVFRANENAPEVAHVIKLAAAQNDLNYIDIDYPFKWGEDFGAFTQKFKGAMFGIGAGTDHPALHNPDYDFPDEITPTGILMYQKIYTILQEKGVG